MENKKEAVSKIDEAGITTNQRNHAEHAVLIINRTSLVPLYVLNAGCYLLLLRQPFSIYFLQLFFPGKLYFHVLKLFSRF